MNTSQVVKIPVTFKVVNGKYKDDNTTSRVVTLETTVGKGATLTPAQVKTITDAMTPDAGFNEGKWDVEPNTTPNAITKPVVYTFTYLRTVTNLPLTGGAAPKPATVGGVIAGLVIAAAAIYAAVRRKGDS